MATLYHFTSTYHLPFIMAHGRVTTSDSDVAVEQYAAPRCVWCTTDPEPEGKHGLHARCAVNKEEVRFTLEVPDDLVHEWREWATTQNMDAHWRSALTRSAGGERVTDTWRIVFQHIPASMWVAVDNLKTGETYDLAHVGYDENDEYSDFVEREFSVVVAAVQHRLLVGDILGVAEGDVCALFAGLAASSGVVTQSEQHDISAWLARSNIPVSFLSAVFVGAPHALQMGRTSEGEQAVVCQRHAPQMNRAQRRTMARHEKGQSRQYRR